MDKTTTFLFCDDVQSDFVLKASILELMFMLELFPT